MGSCFSSAFGVGSGLTSGFGVSEGLGSGLTSGFGVSEGLAFAFTFLYSRIMYRYPEKDPKYLSINL